jgi:hypothetical protein
MSLGTRLAFLGVVVVISPARICYGSEGIYPLPLRPVRLARHRIDCRQWRIVPSARTHLKPWFVVSDEES